MFSLTPEQILENYNKFKALALKTGDHRLAGITAFLAHFEERLSMCPASSKVEFHNAFSGGLVEHSLRVLNNAVKIAKVMEIKLNQEELVFACLFHDIGKLGDIDEERYLPQDEEYWFKRGNVYKVNPKARFMTVPDGGLFLLQHFGVKVSYNEMLGILLNDGHFDETNAPYKMKESDLAVIVHQADLLATRWEKKRMDESK